MSAYGTIAKPTGSGTALSPAIWACKPNSKQGTVPSTPTHLTVHHLTLATAQSQPGLIDHLRAIFALDIEAGRTYPQETISGDGVFEAYFFGADVFLGILGEGVGNAGEGVKETDIAIDDSRQSRSWEDCVAGFYYVKPNYPGRSSHANLQRRVRSFPPSSWRWLRQSAGQVVSPLRSTARIQS
ncbi:hypothetical protein HWV62_27206 [Athelia sp. TMB]|nr:hypothetical protein HWV62_27206 [Athelia sp. TMB]